MSALRPSARSFAPAAQDEYEYEDEPYYEDEPEYVAFDAVMQDILALETEGGTYYIKGGKAYNHYYPNGYVPTSDYDLVATPAMTKRLFGALHHTLQSLRAPLWVEGQDTPFYIESISSKRQEYDDVRDGKVLHNVVESFLVKSDKDLITLVDVIVQDEHDSILSESQEDDGLWYMKKALFDQDVMYTFNARKDVIDKIVAEHKNKPMKSKVRYKLNSLKHKMTKSKKRVDEMSKNKLGRRSHSRYSIFKKKY